MGISKKLLDKVKMYKQKNNRLFHIEAMFNTIAMQNGYNCVAPLELKSIVWKGDWSINEFLLLPNNAIFTQPIISFSILAIYFMGKKGNYNFIYSLIFASIAAFCQGNGKVALLCCLIMLLIRKEFKKIVIWLLFSILILIIPDIIFGSTHSGYKSIIEILQFPIENIRHYLSFFSFLGTHFESKTCYGSFYGVPSNLSSKYGNGIITIIFGGIIFIYFCYLIKIKYYRKNLIVFSLLLFIIITACGVAYGRPSVFFPSRYALYSSVAITLIYISIVDLYKVKIMPQWAPILFAFMIIIGSMYQYSIVPLKIKFYQITVLNLERNLVLNLYNTGEMNKVIAIKDLNNELINMKNDPIISIYSNTNLTNFLSLSNIWINEMLLQKEEWFNEYIPIIVNDIRLSDKFRIYENK
jgi:hypothetical protein